MRIPFLTRLRKLTYTGNKKKRNYVYGSGKTGRKNKRSLWRSLFQAIIFVLPLAIALIQH